MEPTYVGIDVSKDRLDVAVLPSGEAFVVSRDAVGLDDLLARLHPLAPGLVALEATGGFETVVAATLGAAGLAVPGWTLPGLMSVGAAQTMLKAQALVPEGRVVIAGCGPLVWLAAAQLVAAGSPPALLLETTPRANWRAALPHLPAFLLSPYVRKGLALMARVRRAVRVVSGVAALRIEANAGALEVTWPGGRAAADRVLLHQGVVPQLNLAQAAGCSVAWDAGQACFVPGVDAWGDTVFADGGYAGKLVAWASRGADAGTSPRRTATMMARSSLTWRRTPRSVVRFGACSQQRPGMPARSVLGTQQSQSTILIPPGTARAQRTLRLENRTPTLQRKQ